MKFFLLGIIFFIASPLLAQNRVDAAGKKQGPWKKYYEGTGQVRYEGQFVNDQPAGTFRYYLPDGKLSAIVEHIGNGVSYARNFDEKEQMISEGKYIGQKKDSTWTFYDAHKNVLSRENYKDNRKHGTQYVYFTNGKVSMQQDYVKDTLHGRSLVFSESGQLLSEDNFVNGVREGVAKAYGPGGKVVLEGSYKKGKKEGNWTSYQKDGTVEAYHRFIADRLDSLTRMNGEFEEYFPNELLKARYTYRNGRKNGPFVEYHEGGTWTSVERTDPRSGEKDLYREPSNHFVKRRGSYMNNLLHGTVEVFDKKGLPQEKLQYVNGKLQN